MTDCHGCGTPVDEETGISLEMDDFGAHNYYCLTCRPLSHGYTVADLQAMRAENEVQRELARGRAELRIVEADGMDVLSALHGAPE